MPPPSYLPPINPACSDDVFLSPPVAVGLHASRSRHLGHLPGEFPLPHTRPSSTSSTFSQESLYDIPPHTTPSTSLSLPSTVLHSPSGSSEHVYNCLHHRHLSRDEKASLRQAVYNIRCGHCDTLFTDRGMKAVLLLQPHLTLYSTDAMPHQCAPIHVPEPLLGDVDTSNDFGKERTCNCLTQTLACHGCGTVVGYNVVFPCDRCTQNVGKHPRGLNGHRIVFYYSEIATTKRRYIRGDRGIKAMMIPPRFGLLIQEQSSLLARIRTLDPAGTSPPVIAEAALFCMGEEADAQCSPQEETRVLKQRLWRLNQEMRMICTFLLDQYHSGARMIVPGEPLSWADLVDSGERPRPLSSNAALDEPPVAR